MRRLDIWAPPASILHLAHRCAFPWTSGLYYRRSQERSAEARYGDAVHLASSTIVDMGRPELARDKEALARLSRWLGAPLAEDQQKALPWDVEAVAETLAEDMAKGFVRAEVGYAYNLLTGEVREVPRGERKRPNEVRGWADLVILGGPSGPGRPLGTKCATVADWKAGRGPIERPEDSDQQRFLGLCVALYHGLDRVRVELRRLPGGGELRIQYADLDAWALQDVQGELDALARRLAEPPKANPGPWCRQGFGCDVIDRCPSTEALAVAALIEAKPWMTGVGLQPKTAEEAAAAWGVIGRLRAAADRLEGNLEVLLPMLPEPPQLAPGVELVLSQREGAEKIVQTEQAMTIIANTLTSVAAENGLQPSLALDVSQKAFSRSTSKADIDEALRGVWKPRLRGRPEKVEEVYARLRKADVLKKGEPSVRLEERAARPKEG